MNSVLEQYRIADFIEWHDQKRLVLNPHFQRRNVWTLDAKSYFIDTILRHLPMPKIYMRTIIDVVSQRSVREIVDGQQRMRAILDFAKGLFRLNKRAGEYQGLVYENLEDDLKERFLGYSVSVEQLINASDNDVLQVFARLNSYTVPLNKQELRNAKYQGDFKWKVREVAGLLADFWDTYAILSKRDRLRMLDDEFTAEMFSVILEGVCDGGQRNIEKLYERYDRKFPQADKTGAQLLSVVTHLTERFDEVLRTDLFSRPPQFLMLFAAATHLLHGIPQGDLGEQLPPRVPISAIDPQRATANLAVLDDAVMQGLTSGIFGDFVKASLASTQRIASRRPRFLHIWRALDNSL